MPTNVIGVNVYRIDDQPVGTGNFNLFPSNSMVSPYEGGNDARLYSIIKGTDGRNYAVIETPSQLKAIMNA